jgi:hypothetical protein
MSAIGTAVDPFFERQTTDDWRARGGLTYRTVPDIIDRLPRGLQNAATKVYKCSMRFLARCGLDPLQSTNPAMAAEMGMSVSSFKKGFRALREPYELVRDPEAEDGWRKEPLPPILESVRKHGRRKIQPGPESKLAKKGDSPVPKGAAPPPGPPPEKREDPETTTTGEPSSSSPESPPEKTAGPDPALVRALYERARQLLTDVSFGAVSDAVVVFTADSVRRMLDLVEKRNRKLGNVRKPWGYGLGILKKKKCEGWPEEDPEPAKAAAKEVRKQEPLRRLTAEEVAELVILCKAPGPEARFARKGLVGSVKAGEIPPELVATIPADLLEPDPRAP